MRFGIKCVFWLLLAIRSWTTQVVWLQKSEIRGYITIKRAYITKNVSSSKKVRKKNAIAN